MALLACTKHPNDFPTACALIDFSSRAVKFIRESTQSNNRNAVITTITVRKGLDVPLVGRPQPHVETAGPCAQCTIYPGDFSFARTRAVITENQPVRRGDILFYDRKNEHLKVRAPFAGRIVAVVSGARRVVEKIVVEPSSEKMVSHDLRCIAPATISRLSADEIIAHWCDTGALALIEQRPYCVRADPAMRPKSVFINGMNTAPFHPDFTALVGGSEAYYQAGLDALARIAPGRVFQCLDGRAKNLPKFATESQSVSTYYFVGPHPSGNTSVHIYYLDPIKPGDIVWTVRAAGVIALGYALLEGTLPPTRVVSLGGPAVLPDARRHYRVYFGQPISSLLQKRVAEGEIRCIAGDVLSGRMAHGEESIRLHDEGFTVLHEGRERRFLGWIMPGLDQFSRSSSFLSWWFRRGDSWPIDTNMHGSLRAMVLTGLHDQYLPMNIMADFLIRAILARDYGEAIKLGLLEVAPEDFALPAFVCPSKMDLMSIVRRGLRAAQEEGF